VRTPLEKGIKRVGAAATIESYQIVKDKLLCLEV